MRRIEERSGHDKRCRGGPADGTGAGTGAGGRVVILAGPTASGKSALAIDLAEQLDGEVVNADSMQVYRDLPILTAQPSAADRARVPHQLYGFLDLDDVCDAQRWAGLAAAELNAILARGRCPIVVGGTGLYLRALTEGFSPLPEIPPEVRQAARERVASDGPAAVHAALAALDPALAARLKPNDRQRIARGWEVVQATGQPLSWWQAQAPVPPTAHRFHTIVMAPDRATLYAAADARFTAMVAQGVLDEVRAAAAIRPAGGVVAGGRKALGYAELAAWASGLVDPEAAILAAQQATRRYAKRQSTWFRHQVAGANFISSDLPAMKFSQSYTAELRHKIRDFLLTP